MKVSVEQVGEHYISEIQHPSLDTEQWMAYLCINHLFPSTTYWSMDGYHVHALVDYELNLLWEGDKIMSTDRAHVLRGVKDFHNCTTKEIVLEWKKTVEMLKVFCGNYI